ncbi:MAG: hypothetical protein HYX63_01380 [Gammaproteobacteria bacterium]|nr:hypothetical protein [Gammaproteobacteria bacterium]
MIKRYDICAVIDPDGRYVTYEDHKEQIGRLQRIIELMVPLVGDQMHAESAWKALQKALEAGNEK